jgi:hypothetical protein
MAMAFKFLHRFRRPVRDTIAWTVLLSIAWVLVLAAAPDLHETVHAGSDNPQHQCAVASFHSGGYDVEHGPVSTGAPAAERCESLKNSAADWVPPVFLVAAVLEHAPPIR